MTEDVKTVKKPLWETIDEKDITEGKNEYQQRVGAEKARLTDYQYKQQNANSYSSPTMKAHYAVLVIQQRHYVEMLEAFYNLAESFIDMHQQIGLALSSLQSQIEEISQRTGVDISTVKLTVEELRTTVSSPKIDAVAKFLESIKNAAERGKVAGDQYVE